MDVPQRVKDIAEATPATGAVVIGTLSLPVDTWLKIGGLIFLALQVLYLLWRWRRDYVRDRDDKPPILDD